MEKAVRKPNRLKEYDYNQDGVYFVTICTQNRQQILSKIYLEPNNTVQIQLAEYGRIVEKYINSIQYHNMLITVNHYVIMPDHVHMLLSVQNPDKKENKEIGTSRAPSPTNAVIPRIIAGLKRLANKEIGFNIWQRSYYDHIIRDEDDYWNIWQYIEENPARWVEKMK